MRQPYTGAFTITKTSSSTPVPIGVQAVVDHLVYFLLNLFNFAPKTTPVIEEQPPSPIIEMPVVTTPVPTTDRLTKFCLAIQSREGYFAPGERDDYPHGTPAYYNRNPGNLRCTEGNKANWNRRATAGGATHNNFCVFPDYDTGFRAMKETTEKVCMGESPLYNSKARALGLEDSSELSILQYFVIRDPASDGNDPASFASEVAGKLGLSTDTPMGEILL